MSDVEHVFTLLGNEALSVPQRERLARELGYALRLRPGVVKVDDINGQFGVNTPSHVTRDEVLPHVNDFLDRRPHIHTRFSE